MNKKLQVDKAVDQREKVIKVLDTLTEREQAVMKLRFGLEDGRCHTPGETGREMQLDPGCAVMVFT